MRNRLPQFKYLPIPCSLSWCGLGWAIEILGEIPKTLYIPYSKAALGTEILGSDEFVHLGLNLCMGIDHSERFYDRPMTEEWSLSGKGGSVVLSGEV